MMRERLESQARIVWKSFLGALPVICFYLFLFCTVLALFGTQYIMVVSHVTVLFQTNYRKRKSWASLVRAADTPFWEKAARTALEERGDELLGEAGEGEDELHISVRNFLHPFLILLGKLTRGRGTRRGRPGPCQGTSGLWESCCTRCGRTALRLVLPCA